MPLQDITPTKDKILEVIKRRGPSLPVHISNEIKISMLFAGAFLADLLSNKEVKISNMRVGNTPIYFIPGQEPLLEHYSQYLKSREKDAYLLLKENKFLEDEKQEPAIRVALRAIKDFAVPIQKNDKILWRYFTTPETEYQQANQSPQQQITEESSKEKEKIIEEKVKLVEEEISKEKISEEKEELGIFDKKEDIEENFIEKVLKFLGRQEEIKILEETEVKKKEFLGIGRIDSKLGETEILVLAKDKKKITSKDLLKVEELIVEYKRIAILFSNGELDKKAIEDYRKLKNIIFIKNI